MKPSVWKNMKEEVSRILDVSEYQGRIRWSYVDTLEKKYPLHFVFIRYCWKRSAKIRLIEIHLCQRNKMIRGAYHRPNENSLNKRHSLLKQ
jgi:lysozyme